MIRLKRSTLVADGRMIAIASAAIATFSMRRAAMPILPPRRTSISEAALTDTVTSRAAAKHRNGMTGIAYLKNRFRTLPATP